MAETPGLVPTAMRGLTRLRPGTGWIIAASLAPGVAILLFLFFLPIVVLVVLSFLTSDPDLVFVKVFTLSNYQHAIADGFYLHALANTLALGAWVTCICLLIAYPLSLYLAGERPAVQGLLLAILITPLFTSVVVRSYGWAILLQENGPVNSALAVFHLGPVRTLGTLAAVVIGMVHIELAFMVLPVLASLRAIPANVIEAARTLGAGRLRTLVTIQVPLSAPGVAAGCALVFGMTASAFVQPALLGGSRTFLLAPVIYNEVNAKFDWPQASALGFELLLVALVVAVVSARWSRARWRA